MGGLIQTKGTQRLAHLFNNRFDKASLPKTRDIKTSSGTTLKAAFATLPDLLTISDTFIAQNSSSAATWVPKGRDVLYPGATLVAVAVAGSDITFDDPIGGWPALIANGVSASDLKRSLGVPKGALVTNVVPSNPAGKTTVTFSKPVTAQVGDCICFCPLKHQNLVRRWRHYLEHDLDPSNHAKIQGTVLTALTDPSVTEVKFQALEHTVQSVFVETILGTTNDEDDNIDPNHKSLFVALMTARTTAPDPIDDP